MTIIGAGVVAQLTVVLVQVFAMPIITENEQETMTVVGGLPSLAALALVPVVAGVVTWWLTRRRTA